MCWNGKCFDFSDYLDQRVAVAITGPGFLEYSWALETIVLLTNHGAKVSVLDFSELGSVYSLRLNKFGFHFPSISRKVLRNLLIQKNTRFEILLMQHLEKNLISHHKICNPSMRRFFPGFRKIGISRFQGQNWGNFKSTEILISLFSSFERELLATDSKVNYSIASQVRGVLNVVNEWVRKLGVENYDCIFLANGRQPIQAALTTSLRQLGKPVFLYEAGGGHIFPERLQKRISY